MLMIQRSEVLEEDNPEAEALHRKVRAKARRARARRGETPPLPTPARLEERRVPEGEVLQASPISCVVKNGKPMGNASGERSADIGTLRHANST